jgi:ribonucleoside-diphosphate reductase beta chain
VSSHVLWSDVKKARGWKLPRIQRKKSSYTMDYPQAVKFAETQMEAYWLPTEIDVSKDVQDFRTNLTESERHGVITVLKLFTLYEVLVGNEYWGGRIKKEFPRPDIEFMATTFGFVEIGIHARFYNRLNEVMMLDTDEFYESYTNDSVLSARMKFINSVLEDSNLPVALGAFSMLEGAVLYSSFAFLKHFQAQGKNKLKNVCSGINFSVRDENIHALAGAWLYSTLVDEMKALGQFDEHTALETSSELTNIAHTVYEHEEHIIDMIFEKGPIEGLDPEDMKTFVKSRINLCMRNLNLEEPFEVKENPIADYFYRGINAYQYHDFFVNVGSEYGRKASAEDFEW